MKSWNCAKAVKRQFVCNVVTLAGLTLAICGGYLAGTSCSALNREGPDVTCDDLRNGEVNACKDGIIATCVGDRVVYRVCDDSKACDQDWQLPGAYICGESKAE